MEEEKVLQICEGLIKSSKKVDDICVDVDRFSDEYEGHIWWSTKRNLYEICSPHDGNGYKWLFRRGRSKNFDRWANSTTEEHFYQAKELIKRIKIFKIFY